MLLTNRPNAPIESNFLLNKNKRVRKLLQKRPINKIKVWSLYAFFILNLSNLSAQTTLELLGTVTGGGPAGSGPTTNAQTVKFYTNSTTPYSPAITATYTLSNQQFTSTEGNPSVPGTTFGGSNQVSSNYTTAYNLAASSPIYAFMNSISGTNAAILNPFYTACNSCAAGTGIDIASNYAIRLFNASDALINSSGNSAYATNARVQFADLTITFSQPVTNPIVHLTGMGGFYNYFTFIPGYADTYYTQGFSTEMDLITSGLSWTKRSGNSAFNVSSTQVTNSASRFGSNSIMDNTIDGFNRMAASGSVVVNGTNITSLTMRLYLKGDGGTISNGAGSFLSANNSNIIRWSASQNFVPNGQTANGFNSFSGDAFLVGLSLEEPPCTPSVSIVGATTICSGGAATLTATPSGGNGTCTVQWQSSTDNNSWADIGGATGNTYTANSLTTNTYFRARINCTGSNCVQAFSNTQLITVVADPSVSVVAAASTVCVGGSVVLNATLSGGTGSCTIQWQSSPNGTTWTNISGAIGNSFTASMLTANIRYRAQITCSGNGCCN